MKKRERIYNRIRRKREEGRYRQSDVAFMLGHKNSSQVSCYERGLIMPDSENMMKLCYSLNTMPEGLYCESTRRWKEEIEKSRESLKENRTNIKKYER